MTVRKVWLKLLGFALLAGCQASTEQQAVDAYNRGVARGEQRESDRVIVDCSRATHFNPE